MFDEVYAVNVKAPFFLTAAIAPAMSARGSGSIINLGSWVARFGNPRRGAIRLNERSHGNPDPGLGRGVRVAGRARKRDLAWCCKDPRSRTAPPPAMMNGTPYGAFGTPEAIAHAAVYLGSDESSFVNGTVIDVDGGRAGVAVIAD